MDRKERARKEKQGERLGLGGVDYEWDMGFTDYGRVSVQATGQLRKRRERKG